MEWVECVPNFSEGRDPSFIDALAAAIESVPEAHLLDIHRDAWPPTVASLISRPRDLKLTGVPKYR